MIIIREKTLNEANKKLSVPEFIKLMQKLDQYRAFKKIFVQLNPFFQQETNGSFTIKSKGNYSFFLLERDSQLEVVYQNINYVEIFNDNVGVFFKNNLRIYLYPGSRLGMDMFLAGDLP